MGRPLRSLFHALVPTVLLALAAIACGGGDSGETDDWNEPGGDTDLEPDISLEHSLGGLAVEKDEAHIWVVNQGQRFEYPEEEGDPVYITDRKAWLTAVTTSGTGLAATNVLDVSTGTDRRMSFPVAGRAIYFEQQGIHTERMVRIDTSALAPTLDVTVPGHFTDTRTSPSRSFVVANDQLAGGWRVALIHSSSLQTAIVPQDGFLPQGVWNNQSDRLWTVTMGNSPAWARVKRLRVDAIDELETEIDVYLEGFGCDPKFDYSWVAISPDDRWAVFPLWQGADRKLTVIDQLDGSNRVIPGSGPVGFTPDGSLIVSWGPSEEEWQLYLTDPVTLETDTVPIPGYWAPEYYTSAAGTAIVITTYGESLYLYDWDAGGMLLELPVPYGFVLEEFVARPGTDELWLASSYGDLHRLDLSPVELEEISPGFPVGHLNVLPSRDALVVSEPTGGRVRIYGMASRNVEALIELPDPLL